MFNQKAEPPQKKRPTLSVPCHKTPVPLTRVRGVLHLMRHMQATAHSPKRKALHQASTRGTSPESGNNMFLLEVL